MDEARIDEAERERNNLCLPVVDFNSEIISYTYEGFHRFYDLFDKPFKELPNAKLFFCGFSFILIPLIVSYWLLFVSVLVAELIILAVIGIVIGLFYVLIGIWPAIMMSFVVSGVTIMRIPWNIYYHCLVTYRTVMLKPTLKLASFLLLPIVHLLLPVFAFITALIVFVSSAFLVSFIGFPLWSWDQIKPGYDKFRKKFVTDVESFANNYGHPSGIPENWDGTMYGLPIDPMSVLIAVLMYVYAIIPVTLGVMIVWIIKAIPIFIGAIQEFWNVANICKAIKWYIEVFKTNSNNDDTIETNNTDARNGEYNDTGHKIWIGIIFSFTKGPLKYFKTYGNMKILESYNNILKNHYNRIQKLDPEKLMKLITTYCGLFYNIFPTEMEASIIVLVVPIVLAILMWFVGLVLVLTIPPASFVTAFLVWVVAWVFVIILPPVFYIAGWIFIIFGIPILYVITWISVLIGLWCFVKIGSVSGPFLALLIPYNMLKLKMYNPVEMWSGIKRGLLGPIFVVSSADHYSSKFSTGKFKLFGSFEANLIDEKGSVKRKQFNYWDLYINKCIKMAGEVKTKGWLSEDDILSASSTTMIAVPGVTIINILVESIKQDESDKTLIYWSKEEKCNDLDRDMKDNVANQFWPLLMRIKESLMTKNVDKMATWISASLCDGEDECSKELKTALEDHDLTDDEMKTSIQIRARVENIVHSLLRVQEMNVRLHLIFEANYD